jgi:hypothetical protein
MTARSVPPPPGPPPPRRGAAGNPALPWVFALAMVVVVAAAVVAVVWLTRGDGSTAATGPTTSVADSSSTGPTSATSSPSTSTTFMAAAASSTSTSTATSTSTTATTTTTLPPGACVGAGAGLLPGGATIAVEGVGDFDGDGNEDRFLVYSDAPFTWWSRVELSYGYAAVAPDSSCYEVAGLRSVDLGGPAQLAVVESVDSMGLRRAAFYALHECSLDVVRQEDGTAGCFLLRDGPLAKRGITCREDGIEVTTATSADGINWQASTSILYWDPLVGRFLPDPVIGFVLSLHSPEDDAVIGSYAAWDC